MDIFKFFKFYFVASLQTSCTVEYNNDCLAIIILLD